MRKNFRHLKHCLKRNLQRLKNDFYMTRTPVICGFAEKPPKKNPERIGVFSFFLQRIDHQKMLIG
jgi:hypothetical protein